MRTCPKVRGLQDVVGCGKRGGETPASIMAKLAQLEGEKARIAQERLNWQEKIALIDARLAQIEEVERRLRPLLAEKEQAARDADGPTKRFGRITAHEQAPPDEVTTIRY